MAENDLFTIFPDLPWRRPRILPPASRIFGPGLQPPETARRRVLGVPRSREHGRVTSLRIAQDALRHIQMIARNERRRNSKSGHSPALDDIIATTDAALRSTWRRF
jgi:hypothetical protein